MARVIAVGIVQNEKGQCLICKKPVALGVFPGQWGLPGGGIDDGETIEISLRRELREEVGLIEFPPIQAYLSGQLSRLLQCNE